MKKKSISSLELAALINELQFLTKGKVSQIYHQEKTELLLQLHAPGEGKQLLKIVPGKFLCLTKNKNPPIKPSGFCMQLRKYLDNAFIQNVYQKKAERIVIFEFDKKGMYYLIVELFSKGNIILTNGEYQIIGALEQQTWKDRTVRSREKYVFPTPGVNWKEIKLEEFREIIEKSDKKNLATTLATEVNLGGVYAEEVCSRAPIDKNKLPKDVNEKETKLIFSEIKEIVRLIENPKGFIYEEQLTPIPLTKEKLVGTTKTYNESINMLKPFVVVSPYEKRINTIKRMINEQEGAIESLQKKIELNKQKGELIYEKYTPLQKMIEIVKDLKKEKGWEEVASQLKKEKNIKHVDLKNKKIVINL